jgi:hypothetical protein
MRYSKEQFLKHLLDVGKIISRVNAWNRHKQVINVFIVVASNIYSSINVIRINVEFCKSDALERRR